MNRLKVVLIGLLYWFVFGAGTLVTLVGQLLGIAVYGCFGSEAVRAWVYATGKGTDGINNAAWFGGNAKETISSHAGRWFVSGRTDVPLRFRAVKWITDRFDSGHVTRSIEDPFRDEPL